MAHPHPQVPTHVLNPCMLFVPREEHVISTLLGSCVSVCLWDPRLKLGGMNHFMLPLWNGKGLPTPKFGNIATEKLIQNLLMLGCRKEDLIAKVFGGATVVGFAPGMYPVGSRNIQLAEEILDAHGIPIQASEVGGERAMKIDFNSRHGTVILRRVVKLEWTPLSLPDPRTPT
jgi:chemotaxis protein CheD